MAYEDKLESLRAIFGTSEVRVEGDNLHVGPAIYPILEGVIILTGPDQYTDFIRQRLGTRERTLPLKPEETTAFAEDIQFSFGSEWVTYNKILPEHAQEFSQYFDIAKLDQLSKSRVCDLGCGIGRWSYFLKDRCKELVLVDFSDAIFVARKNLQDARNALFFHCDLTRLPFCDNFADFLFCLGVLHHLPTPCLDEVRRLKRYAPSNLIFLYYALDNRPFYFRWILHVVTGARMGLSRLRQPRLRKAISWLGAYGIYGPLILLGRCLKPVGLSRWVPLYEFYNDKSMARIEQDVYDRFFTRIEQRVSRAQIMTLTDTYSRVTVSPHLPYWHFLCER